MFSPDMSHPTGKPSVETEVEASGKPASGKYGMRSSPRTAKNKAAGNNGTPSEPSTSRRTPYAGTPGAVTPSETPTGPKRRKITDYMSRVSSAQPKGDGSNRKVSSVRLRANGLSTPTEGPSSPNTDGHGPSSLQEPPQIPASADLSSTVLKASDYPWGNHPIAVAMWVLQKVHNARPMVSPAPTCQASGYSTPQMSATPIPDGPGHEDTGYPETKQRRKSRRLKNLDNISDMERNLERRTGTINGEEQSKLDAETKRSGVEVEDTGSFNQSMQRLVLEIAPKVMNFKPFAPGYGDTYFDTKSKERGALSKDTIDAGKLFFNVLPALLGTTQNRKCQAAADALIHLIDSKTSDSPRCREAIEIMSHDPELLLGASIITTQFCVGSLFPDIDASIPQAGEYHNNTQSPSPNNGDDDVNRPLSILSKTKNNNSNTSLKKHLLVNPNPNTNLGHLDPHLYQTPEKHSLVDPTSADTYPRSLNLPHSQIHNLVTCTPVTDHIPTYLPSDSSIDNHPHLPPFDSSLQNTTDNPPPARHQEPYSPSQSIETMVRASTRARKPTERALEAAASQAASKRTARKPAPKKAVAPAKEEAGIKTSEDEVLVARLLELASAAVAPGFTPEHEINLEELRKEFYDNLAAGENGQGSQAAVPATTSDGSAVVPAPAALDHPTMERPWTDEDGWTHTGQLNDHGEEIVLVPSTFVWHRPNNTFNDPLLPPPRPRMKSVAQIERDRVFGFPPPLGERNLPAGDPRPRKRSREDMESGQTPPADDAGGARKKPKTTKAVPAAPAPAPTTTTAAAAATTADTTTTTTAATDAAPAPTTASAPAPATTNATTSKRGGRSRAPKKEHPAPSRKSARTRAAQGASNDNA
ncbi:hypothetical protein FQN54_001853 [Arachnomyces sp. PD_36]|nr:hypothetical protein FQN54_001853 [Arachnomyces sp. PD_36]